MDSKSANSSSAASADGKHSKNSEGTGDDEKKKTKNGKKRAKAKGKHRTLLQITKELTPAGMRQLAKDAGADRLDKLCIELGKNIYMWSTKSALDCAMVPAARNHHPTVQWDDLVYAIRHQYPAEADQLLIRNHKYRTKEELAAEKALKHDPRSHFPMNPYAGASYMGYGYPQGGGGGHSGGRTRERSDKSSKRSTKTSAAASAAASSAAETEPVASQ